MKIDLQLCAELCIKSYEDKTPLHFVEVDSFFCDLRFGVVKRNGINYIVFRGSRSLSNWLRNFRVFGFSKTNKGSRVHRGFYSAFKYLSKHIKVEGPTVFVGHSLGGDIARIFAEEYDCPAVTFGAARCFWKWWGKIPDNSKHYSIVCDDDPVPKIPRINFKHDYKKPWMLLSDKDGRRIQTEDHDMVKAYQIRLKEQCKIRSINL